MNKTNSEKKMFPNVAEATSGNITQEERYAFYYPVVKRYLKNVINGVHLSSFLEKYNMKKVVLYAANELAELICMDLASNHRDSRLRYICDRNYNLFPQGFCGKNVCSLDKLTEDYQNGNVDKIIICNLLREHEIYRDLMLHQINAKDILTIADVVFDEG